MLPAAFLDRTRALLGTEAEAFLAALGEPRVNSLRANTLKLAPAELPGLLGVPLEPVPWCPAGFYVSHEARAGAHPLHAAGAYYVQEASAMAVAEALAPQPGERVLDLAAAPGGKATHLAALMGGEGLLVANEPVPGRARVLAENLERLGCPGVVTSEEPARLAGAWGAYFDRVLVDAPCSGEGMFRKDPDAAAEWSPGRVAACARQQEGILDGAAALLRPGGTLAYSTCTFAPEENEAVIADFLERHRNFDLLAVPGFDSGRPEWGGGDPRLVRTARLWPHRLRGEGHFVALLRKVGGEEGEPGLEPAAGLDPKSARAWRDFAAEFAVPDVEPTVFRGEVQALHPLTPSLRGLKVVRIGPPLAELKPGRLEPAHALAHLYPKNAAVAALDLAPGDPRLAAYLRGETVEAPGPSGWVLARLRGLGLGWGKRVGGTVKNHYPRWLRAEARTAG